MAKKLINIGSSANAGNGDPLRLAFGKINDNFNELYTVTGGSISALTELAQDYAAPLFTHEGHSGITFTYDDLNNRIIATIATDLVDSITDFGQGFGLNGAGKIVTNKLYSTSLTQPNQNYTLELGTDGILRIPYTIEFPDSSIQTTAYRYTASSTAPALTAGSLWFNTNEGKLYVNYNNNWIDANPTEIDADAVRFNNLNQIELLEGGDIVDFNGNSVLGNATRLYGNVDEDVEVTVRHRPAVSANCNIAVGDEFVADTETNDDITVVQVGWTVDVGGTEYTVTSIDPAPPAWQYRITAAGATFVQGTEYTFTNPTATLQTWTFNQQTGTLIAPGGAILSSETAVVGEGDAYRDFSIEILNPTGTNEYRWLFDNTAGALTFPDGTTTTGKSITVPVDQSLTVNTSYSMGPGGATTFKISPEHIKLPTGNGVIFSGTETAANSWGLDSANKTLYFPDAGDGVNPQIYYSKVDGVTGMELMTYAKSIKITAAQTSSWTFGADGELSLPTNGYTEAVIKELDATALVLFAQKAGANVKILAGATSAGSAKQWLFDGTNGRTMFPNGVVPEHSYGAAGDKEGMVVFSDPYIYYCKQDYVDNSTDIWVRVAWTGTNW